MLYLLLFTLFIHTYYDSKPVCKTTVTELNFRRRLSDLVFHLRKLSLRPAGERIQDVAFYLGNNKFRKSACITYITILCGKSPLYLALRFTSTCKNMVTVKNIFPF